MNKLFYIIASFFYISFFHASAQEESYKLKTVVIDAGHGGKDPGALGSKSKEKDITLAIALKTGKYIEERVQGVKVIYTRTTDEFVELHKRADIANKNNADLFISIHVNANQNPKAYGTDSWVMGQYKSEENLEVAMLENKVISIEEDHSSNYQGFDPTSPESYIAFKLITSFSNENSINLANKVQNELKTKAKRHDRGVKAAPFVVLWQTTMPSILIETGFITNANEEIFLNSEYGQDIVASAIYRAFRDYKEEFDKKSYVAVSPESKDSITFAIQVLATQKQLEGSEVYENEEVTIIKCEKLFKYAVFESESYEEVLSKQKIVKEKYPKAFPIAIKNGETIPIKEALKLKNTD